MLHANNFNTVVSLIALAGLLGSVPVAALAADDLKPFPEPEIGYRRVVMTLMVIDMRQLL